MKVKELIEMLKSCDPEAIVCVEANCDPQAAVVGEYFDKERQERYVYIADNLSEIDQECEDVPGLVRCTDGNVYQYVEYDEEQDCYVCPKCKTYAADRGQVKLLDLHLPSYCNECGTKLRY